MRVPRFCGKPGSPVAAMARLAAAAALALVACAAPAASVINVHIVPHSHDDVGWLKTPLQYYYGQNQSIYPAGVQYIIENVINSLEANPARTFAITEQFFFQLYYRSQTPARQAVIRQLVASGQLNFVNGGWVMHDEANPDFISMIDQQALGVRFLVDEFGPSAAPRVQWQLDPFGAAVQGSLFSSPLSGFTAVVWARISYDDRAVRIANKTLEWVWAPSKSLGTSAMTLAHTLKVHYSSPPNTCWDLVMCNGGEALNVDPTMEGYNAQSAVDDFVAYLDSYSASYRGSELLVLMGDDFQHQDPGMLVNIDRLISATNALQPGGQANGTYRVFYSTPSAWADAVLKSGTSFPLDTFDEMPYADGPHSYWGGYFTSRAGLKGYVRALTGTQTAARQLQVLAGGATDLGPTNPLSALESALGVAQHHDAVAGTSKQHVANDYALRLAAGVASVDAWLGSALAAVTGDASLATSVVTCHLSNVTLCNATEAGVPVLLSVHNADSHGASQPVRLPVGFPAGVASWAVYGPDGKAVPAQVLPLSDADALLRARYGGDAGTSTQWLAFLPSAPVPAAGFAVYFLVPAASAADAPLTVHSTVRRLRAAGAPGLRSAAGADAAGPSSITNGPLTVTFDATTGLVSGLTDASNGVSVPLSQAFLDYIPNQGDKSNGQASGAYIFRPAAQTPEDPAGGAPYTVDLVTGPIVQEARQTAGGNAFQWITQVVRLWSGAPDVEFEWTVGPIDLSNSRGHEVISRYGVGWATAGAWETDSNCREWQPRVRNARPTWNLTLSEPVAQNYVPVNCAAKLTDPSTGNVLTVITDRSQGGSSMVDGTLEIMVHRRLLKDDGRGVNEALNEPGVDGKGLVVRGRHWLSVAPGASAARGYRARWQSGLLGTGMTAFAPLAPGVTPASWLAAHKPTAAALSAALPPNVHAVTLQSWGPSSLLVRLAHLFEVGEDATLSGNVTVSLAGLVAGYKITAATEMTLIASVPLADVPPATYTIDGAPAPITLPVVPPAPSGASLDVTLGPMQIRTFLCTLAPAAAA